MILPSYVYSNRFQRRRAQRAERRRDEARAALEAACEDVERLEAEVTEKDATIHTLCIESRQIRSRADQLERERDAANGAVRRLTDELVKAKEQATAQRILNGVISKRVKVVNERLDGIICRIARL